MKRFGLIGIPDIHDKKINVSRISVMGCPVLRMVHPGKSNKANLFITGGGMEGMPQPSMVKCALAFLSAFVYAGWDGIRNGYGFLQFAVRFPTMLYLLKVFDIIFLDWFLLTKSHFFQHYFPEKVIFYSYKYPR